MKSGGPPVKAGGGFELPSSSASSRRYLTNIAHEQMIANDGERRYDQGEQHFRKSRAAGHSATV